MKNASQSQKDYLLNIAKYIYLDLKKIPGVSLTKDTSSPFFEKSYQYNGVQILKNDKVNEYHVIVSVQINMKMNFESAFQSIINRIQFIALKNFKIVVQKVDIVLNRIDI